jgi:hypothetical protein
MDSHADDFSFRGVSAAEAVVQKESILSRFKCSRCGGRLVYAPQFKSLVCASCQVVTERKTVLQIQPTEIPTDNFIASLSTTIGQVQPIKTEAVHCPGCDTYFLIFPGVLSQKCPNCISPYAMELQYEEEVIIPNGIIPFRISLMNAELALTDWLQSHLDLADVKMSCPIIGTYMPVWTFDIQGKITWGAAVEEYGRETTVNEEKCVNYEDYLMLGTVRVSPVLNAALKGFDLQGLVPFNEQYLASWPAEIFQVSLADASLRARCEILAKEHGEIDGALSHRARNITIHSTNMFINAFRLVLLPIWMGSYEMKGNTYKVVINGQTGCIYGTLPHTAHKSWISEFLGI